MESDKQVIELIAQNWIRMYDFTIERGKPRWLEFFFSAFPPGHTSLK